MEFFLGADPEFVMVSAKTGRIRSPHDIVLDPRDRHELGSAIGTDGLRQTSSLELRPGKSKSGEELVNRMADLLGRLAAHYHPKSICYRAGAYVAPEPLGGHIHLSWHYPPPEKTKDGYPFPIHLPDAEYSDTVWRGLEWIRAMAVLTNILVPKIFDPVEVRGRITYASEHRSDFAFPYTVRPQGGIPAWIQAGHIEYRYPPSWLATPEAAYCFLGGAEIITRKIFSDPVGAVTDWEALLTGLFRDPKASPMGYIPLADALTVAERHVKIPDIIDAWKE